MSEDPSKRNTISPNLQEAFNEFVGILMETNQINLDKFGDESYMAELRGRFLNEHRQVPHQQQEFIFDPFSTDLFDVQQNSAGDYLEIISRVLSEAISDIFKDESFQKAVIGNFSLKEHISPLKEFGISLFCKLVIHEFGEDKNLMCTNLLYDFCASIFAANKVNMANAYFTYPNVKKIITICEEKIIPYLGDLKKSKDNGELDVLFNVKKRLKDNIPLLEQDSNLKGMLDISNCVYSYVASSVLQSNEDLNLLIDHEIRNLNVKVIELKWKQFIKEKAQGNIKNVDENSLVEFISKCQSDIKAFADIFKTYEGNIPPNLIVKVTEFVNAEENAQVILKANLAEIMQYFVEDIFEGANLAPQKLRQKYISMEKAQAMQHIMQGLNVDITNALAVIKEKFQSKDKNFIGNVLGESFYADLERLKTELKWLESLKINEKTSLLFLSLIEKLGEEIKSVNEKRGDLTVNTNNALKIADWAKSPLLEFKLDNAAGIKIEELIKDFVAQESLKEVLAMLESIEDIHKRIYCCAILAFFDADKAIDFIKLAQSNSDLIFAIDLCNLAVFLDVYNSTREELKSDVLTFAIKEPTLFNRFLMACVENKSLISQDPFYLIGENENYFVAKKEHVNAYLLYLNLIKKGFKGFEGRQEVFNQDVVNKLNKLLEECPELCLISGNDELLAICIRFFGYVSQYSGINLDEKISWLEKILKDNRKVCLLDVAIDELRFLIDLSNETFWDFVVAVKDDDTKRFLMDSYASGVSVFNLAEEDGFWKTFLSALKSNLGGFGDADPKTLCLLLIVTEKHKDLIQAISETNEKEMTSTLVELFTNYDLLGAQNILVNAFEQFAAIDSIKSAKEQIIAIIKKESFDLTEGKFQFFNRDMKNCLLHYLAFIPKKVIDDLLESEIWASVLTIEFPDVFKRAQLFAYLRHDYRNIDELVLKIKELLSNKELTSELTEEVDCKNTSEVVDDELKKFYSVPKAIGFNAWGQIGRLFMPGYADNQSSVQFGETVTINSYFVEGTQSSFLENFRADGTKNIPNQSTVKAIPYSAQPKKEEIEKQQE